MTSPIPQTPLRFLWSFLSQKKTAFFATLFFMFVAALREGAGPYLIKLIIDGLHYTSEDMRSLTSFPYVPWAVLAPLIVYFVIQCVNEWMQSAIDWIKRGLIPWLKQNIRETLFHYVQDHAPDYFKNHFAGMLAGRIANTAKGIDMLEDLFMWRLVAPLCRLSVILVLLALHNWVYVAVLFVWMVIFFSVIFVLDSRVRRVAQRFAEQESRVQGQLVDSLGNILSVKSFARTLLERKLFAAQLADEVAKDRDMRGWLMIQTFFMRNSTTFIIGAMLYVILIGWSQGQVSAGEFAMVMMMALQIGYSVNDMGYGILRIATQLGSIQDTLNLVTEPHLIADRPGADRLIVKNPAITLDTIQFQYGENEAIFNGLNLTIPAGQKIGLVGRSGAGKSSLVSLIMRFYDVQSGRVLIDGQDITHVTQDSLREALSVIPQDTSLFHRSLMENIRYGRLDASDEEVMEAACRAHADEFIQDLPDGYHTLVGERGVKLSGGQRQRIAIARAILKDSPILILDEATSALDSESEKLIQASLKDLMQDKTVIAIAHRLSTIANMDRLIVMDQGRILEDGSHQELLDQGGIYSTLWAMQSDGFIQ